MIHQINSCHVRWRKHALASTKHAETISRAHPRHLNLFIQQTVHMSLDRSNDLLMTNCINHCYVGWMKRAMASTKHAQTIFGAHPRELYLVIQQIKIMVLD